MKMKNKAHATYLRGLGSSIRCIHYGALGRYGFNLDLAHINSFAPKRCVCILNSSREKTDALTGRALCCLGVDLSTVHELEIAESHLPQSLAPLHNSYMINTCHFRLQVQPFSLANYFDKFSYSSLPVCSYLNSSPISIIALTSRQGSIPQISPTAPLSTSWPSVVAK